MRGSVVKRGDGYSVGVELDRDPITGKRRQKWHSGYRTKREAERAMTEMVAALHAGTYLEPTRQTLAEFTKDWLAAIEPTIRPSTHYSYDRNLRLHVLPSLVQCRCVASTLACLTGSMRRCWRTGSNPTAGVAYRPAVSTTSTRSSIEPSVTRFAGAG
jgi:hypothetical protein